MTDHRGDPAWADLRRWLREERALALDAAAGHARVGLVDLAKRLEQDADVIGRVQRRMTDILSRRRWVAGGPTRRYRRRSQAAA